METNSFHVIKDLKDRHKMVLVVYIGLLWRLRPNETEMLLNNITRELMDTLEEETGVGSGFVMNGGLFIASTKERLDEYKRLRAVGFKVSLPPNAMNIIIYYC